MDFPPKSSSPEDWFNRCRELCEPLSKEGCKFSFSLQVGTFSFSLKSEGVRLRTKKRRPTPSYLRRQERRKADLLKRRSEQHAEKSAVKGLAQGGENLLNKKMTSPMQVQEGATLLSKKTDPSMQSQAASASYKILEKPPESVKRRSITRLKRDENLTASFHLLDGVPILSPNDSVTGEEVEEREESTEDEATGMAADLEHDRADGEEWCEVEERCGGRSEVKYRRVRGSNYCGHPVEVRAINDIYEFNEDGDNIIVFAPRGVYGSDVEIRLFDASFVNGEIDFLRKIRENTYEYVG